MTRALVARRCFMAALLPLALLLAFVGCHGDFFVGVDQADASTAGGAPGTGGSQHASDDAGHAIFVPASSDASPELCTDPNAQCPGVISCPGTQERTLTGTVFDPAGKTPLFNAIVYVPQSTPPAMAPGTSTCSQCAVAVGDYIAATTTDVNGVFTLKESPMGKNIPLVIQMGKWRRQIVVPSVPACETTQVPAELTRLPRNRTEGDIPQMAVLTGACDGIGCFLRHVGLDAQEFTGPDGDGRLHVYRGAGRGPDLAGGGGGTAGDCTGDAGACPLWTTKQDLERYDTVLLGCECGENDQTKPDKFPMHDWLNEGGSVIAVHDQETWFKNGPSDFQSVATWGPEDASAPGPFVVDNSFPRGQLFLNWLSGAGGIASDGTVLLHAADVSASIASAGSQSNRWIFDKGDADASPASVAYLSFLTPIGGVPGANPSEATAYCGKAVVTDVHVGASAAPSNAPIPESCGTGDLSPEEKALEFLLFDQSVCQTMLPKGLPPGPNEE
jgi:hypothetical protein